MSIQSENMLLAAFKELGHRLVQIDQKTGQPVPIALLDFSGADVKYVSENVPVKATLTPGIYYGYTEAQVCNVPSKFANNKDVGFVKVHVWDFYDDMSTAPVGEETRKLVRWEFLVGGHTLVRTVDTGAEVNALLWTSIVDSVDTVDDISDAQFALVQDAAGSKALEVGNYFKSLTGGNLGWAKTVGLLAEEEVIATAQITVTAGVGEEKLIVINLVGALSSSVIYIDSSAASTTARVVGGGAASGDKITPFDFAEISVTPAKVRLAANGLYFSALSALPAWLEADTYLIGTEVTASVVTLIRNDDVNPAEKIATYTVTTVSGSYSFTYSTFTGIKTFIRFTTTQEVEALVTDVYQDMSSAFSRMGYLAGGVVDTLSGQYDSNSADAPELKLGFSSDGTFEVTTKNGISVKTGYWLPFGAVATQYQIKRADTTGAADAGSTLGTDFAAFPANKANATIAVTQPTDGTNLVTSNITIKHTPTSKETVIAVTLNVVNVA